MHGYAEYCWRKCSNFRSQPLELLPKTLRDMKSYVLDWNWRMVETKNSDWSQYHPYVNLWQPNQCLYVWRKLNTSNNSTCLTAPMDKIPYRWMSSMEQTTIGNLLLDIWANVKTALLLYTPNLDGYFLDPTQDEVVQELCKPPDHTHPTCEHNPEWDRDTQWDVALLLGAQAIGDQATWPVCVDRVWPGVATVEGRTLPLAGQLSACTQMPVEPTASSPTTACASEGVWHDHPRSSQARSGWGNYRPNTYRQPCSTLFATPCCGATG